MERMIEVTGLVKSSDFTAVDNISFSVAKVRFSACW